MKLNKDLPAGPGVYLMKDRQNRVIYVGKARDLKERVGHYFSSALASDPKTRTLLSRVKDIDYLATDSEIDALLLEARLIRDIKPKYNIRLKDDKTFPLLAISRADDFPRVFTTRQRGKSELTYYGPFTKAGDLRSALKALQRIFKFRTCRLKLTQPTKPLKACLLYHIKQCVAPCLGKINQSDYQEIIQSLEDFLKGDKETLIKRLTERMSQASRQHDFEQAAFYRDQINALKGITGEGKMGEFYEGALAAIIPSERLKELQRLLHLEELPRKIEGLDISDIKGRGAVGSLVTFIDGEPFKAGYRRYKIKTVTEGESDDYQRMAEVVRRRIMDKENPLPHILLIDGGPGHLGVVQKVFHQMATTPPRLIAIAKHQGDHLYYENQEHRPKSLEYHPGFRLLQYIRDEAHRFAQKYHHFLRQKGMYE